MIGTRLPRSSLHPFTESTRISTHRHLFDNQHPFQSPPCPFKNHPPPFEQPTPFHRCPFDNPHLFKTHLHCLKTPPAPFRQLAPFQNQLVPCQKPTPTIWTTSTLSKSHQHRQIDNPALAKQITAHSTTHPCSKTNMRLFKNKHAPFQKPTPVSLGIGTAHSQNR